MAPESYRRRTTTNSEILNKNQEPLSSLNDHEEVADVAGENEDDEHLQKEALKDSGKSTELARYRIAYFKLASDFLALSQDKFEAFLTSILKPCGYMVAPDGFVVSYEAILAAFNEAPEAKEKYNAIELELLTKMSFLPCVREDARKSVKKLVNYFTEEESDYIVMVMKNIFTNENALKTVSSTMASTQQTYASDIKYYLAYCSRIGQGIYPVPISGETIKDYIEEVVGPRNNGNVSGANITRVGASLKFLNRLLYLADENHPKIVPQSIDNYDVVTAFRRNIVQGRNELQSEETQQPFSCDNFDLAERQRALRLELLSSATYAIAKIITQQSDLRWNA